MKYIKEHLFKMIFSMIFAALLLSLFYDLYTDFQVTFAKLSVVIFAVHIYYKWERNFINWICLFTLMAVYFDVIP